MPEDTYDNKEMEPLMIVSTKDILRILMDLDYFYSNIMVEYENVN